MNSGVPGQQEPLLSGRRKSLDGVILSHWVRSALSAIQRSPLGSFRQNFSLGSFRQNLRWVRSAKIPHWVRSAKIPHWVRSAKISRLGSFGQNQVHRFAARAPL
jgi:hypothetical protein